MVYCSVCGEELSRETVTVDSLGHKYEAEVTEPTYTEAGYTTYTCSVCDDSYVADETAALGHTDGEAVKENEVAPDCVNTGSYDNVVYCIVCKEEVSRETITVPTLKHSHNHYGSDENNHWSICSCGAEVEGTTSAHEYTDDKCVCGAIQVKILFLNDDTVIPHTVKGRTVTVNYDMPCRAGYWDEEQQMYIAIPAVDNENGSYSFTVPEGVEEVLIVITGDTNGDGRVTAPDIARLNAHLKNKTVLTAEELFAADVNYDGRLDDTDKSAMSEAILGMTPLYWGVATAEE